MRRDSDEWTGSMRHPWANPPMKYKLGAARGLWWETMAALSALTIAVFVVLVLVDQDVLSEGWAYSMLPIGVVAVVVMGLVTVFKAVGEEKGQAERGRDQ